MVARRFNIANLSVSLLVNTFIVYHTNRSIQLFRSRSRRAVLAIILQKSLSLDITGQSPYPINMDKLVDLVSGSKKTIHRTLKELESEEFIHAHERLTKYMPKSYTPGKKWFDWYDNYKQYLESLSRTAKELQHGLSPYLVLEKIRRDSEILVLLDDSYDLPVGYWK